MVVVTVTLLLVIVLLWCCCIVPGLLDSATGSWGFVEGIRDHETLSANVLIPESACVMTHT